MKKGTCSAEYAVFKWLWLIILLPKAMQLLLLYLILALILKQRNDRCLRNPVSMGMLILAAIHLFAIAFHLLMPDPEEDRLTAALNTMLLWPLAAGYYACYANWNPDMKRIGQYCCFNLLVLFLEAVAAAVLFRVTGADEIRIGDKALYSWVQFNDVKTTRFIGFNDFSNMNMLYAMLMYALSVFMLRQQRLIWRGIASAMFLYIIFSIRSRSGLLLAGFSLVMCVYDLIPKRFRRLTVCLAVACCLAVGTVFFGKITDLFLNRIIFRNESSNGLRILIWQTSLEEAWEASPIWGMGIKRIFIPGYPLGSHSTYLGFFYKTGILGVIVGLYVIFRANLAVFRRMGNCAALRTVSLFLVSFLVLLALEDVDGSNWYIVLYFSTLAMFSRLPADQRGESPYRLANIVPQAG